MGGCDKTTPGLLMGAISMDLPAIFLPAGPMLRGNWNGRTLGSGSDTWKYWAELRAGKITEEDWKGVESGIARSPGHCMTMGTASTMTSATEALGLTLPGFSSIPAAGFASRADGVADRAAHRRDGVDRSEAVGHPDREVVRQRRHDRARDVRFDQRDRASGRGRAARGHRADARRASTNSRASRRCSRTCVRPASI